MHPLVQELLPETHKNFLHMGPAETAANDDVW